MFIALDIALNQAKKEGRVDVIGIINNMRFQRMKMVQTLVREIMFDAGKMDTSTNLAVVTMYLHNIGAVCIHS